MSTPAVDTLVSENESVTLHIRFRKTLVDRMQECMDKIGIAHSSEFVRMAVIAYLESQEQTDTLESRMIPHIAAEKEQIDG